MAEVTQQTKTEAITRSYSEGARREAGGNRVPSPATRLGERLQRRVEEGRDKANPTAALNELLTRDTAELGEIKGLNVDVAAEVDRRIGIGETQANADTQDRRMRMRGEAVLAQQVAREGINSITDTAVKNDIRDRFITGVLDRRVAFQRLSPEQKQATAEAMLRMPEYRQMLGKVLEGSLSPDATLDAAITESRNAVRVGQERVSVAERRHTETREAYRKNRQDKRDAQTQLYEYTESAIAYGNPPNEYDQIEDLQTTETGNRAIVERWKVQVENGTLTQEQVNQLKQSVQEKLDRGEALTDLQDSEIASLLEAEGRVTNLDKLRAEKGALEQKITDLDVQEADRIREMQESDTEWVNAETDLTLKTDVLADQEERMVREMENIMAEAGNDFLNEDIQQRSEALDKELEEMAKNAKSEDLRRLAKSLKTRWDKPKEVRSFLGRKKIIPELNKGRIEEDFGTIINGGPEALMRRMINEGRMGQMSEDQIIELMKDPEFAALQQKAVERLVTDKVATGKLHPNEVRNIVFSDWGMDALNKAIENNQTLKDKMQQLKDMGVVQGNLEGWLKSRSPKEWMSLIALILGGGALAAGALPLAIGASVGGAALARG